MAAAVAARRKVTLRLWPLADSLAPENLELLNFLRQTAIFYAIQRNVCKYKCSR